MNLRDRIVKTIKRWSSTGPSGIGVRELMAWMPGELKSSVSKECRKMTDLGLLSSESVNNRHHGKKFLYKPTALLLEAGTLQVCAETAFKMLDVPMTLKELRYAMASATGTNAPRRMIADMVEELFLAGRVTRAPGGSVNYPRYVKAGHCATGVELAAVVRAWARMPGSRPQVCLQSTALRWPQPRPG